MLAGSHLGDEQSRRVAEEPAHHRRLDVEEGAFDPDPTPLLGESVDGDDIRFDLSQIVGPEFDGNCSDVLIKALEFPATWDWYNPRLLSEQPSERDLSRCCLFRRD